MSDRVPITFVNDWTGSEITLRLEPLGTGRWLTSAQQVKKARRALCGEHLPADVGVFGEHGPQPHNRRFVLLPADRGKDIAVGNNKTIVFETKQRLWFGAEEDERTAAPQTRSQPIRRVMERALRL